MQEQITRSIGSLAHVQTSSSAVDAEVLANAHGVVIVDEIQWAIGVGSSSGRGVLVKRLANGQWSAPCAISAKSLSIGLAVGGQGRSVVVVFENAETVDRLVGNGSYFLAKAQGTLGSSYGHTNEAVQNDDGVHAYVVAEGVFASAALGNASFSVDDAVNQAAYGPEVSAWDIIDGEVQPPPGARALTRRLERIAGRAGDTAATAAPTPAQVHAPAQTPAAHTQPWVVETPVETAEHDEPAAPSRRSPRES